MSNNRSMEDGIVANASPLITLFKSGFDTILPKLFKRIVVPESVWQEVSVYDDEAGRGLSKAPWVTRENVLIDQRIMIWNLGKGESQVLSWALKKPDFRAVIDDMAARRCSASLSIRHVGTIGLLVLAYQHKQIPSLSRALSQIKNAGLYITDDLMSSLINKEEKGGA